MVTVLYKMPDGSVHVKKGLVKKEKITGTKFIQDKKTGLLKGRKEVEKGGDVYSRNRVQKPFIIKVRRTSSTKGHLRTNGKLHEPGEFF